MSSIVYVTPLKQPDRKTRELLTLIDDEPIVEIREAMPDNVKPLAFALPAIQCHSRQPDASLLRSGSIPYASIQR